MTHPLPSAPRNPAIDWLRGLSILFVVVHHLALSFRLPLRHSLMGDWVSKRVLDAISFNGYESVFVFFVLSGFLIAQRTLERDGSLRAIDWRHFYRQRASRILPLLGLLLTVLSLMHALGVSDYVVAEHGQTLPGALWSAASFQLNWYEGQTGWLPGAWDVLWSLSIEEAFYLVFPLVCLLLPRALLVPALLALAASLPWTHAALVGNEIWQEKAYLPGMSAIAVGVLAALLAQRWTPSRPMAWTFALVGAAGLVNVYGFGDLLWQVLADGELLLLSLSAAMLALAAHWLRPPAVHGLGWLSRMGQLSYEIYLSHMFIVLAVTRCYAVWLGQDMRWTCLVYPPAIWCCVQLGSALARHVGQPAAAWLYGRRPVLTVYAKPG